MRFFCIHGRSNILVTILTWIVNVARLSWIKNKIIWSNNNLRNSSIKLYEKDDAINCVWVVEFLSSIQTTSECHFLFINCVPSELYIDISDRGVLKGSSTEMTTSIYISCRIPVFCRAMFLLLDCGPRSIIYIQIIFFKKYS